MTLDIIGKIYDISGDPENPTVTELAGWHVNSTELIDGLDEYLVTPAVPRRVFSGTNTYFYTFNSETQAKTLLNWDVELGYNPIFKPILKVPSQVTRRQAITILTLAGYVPTINQAISSIQDPTQKVVAEVFWNDSLHFERDNPVLNNLAESIGMTQEELDQLFIQAQGV